MTGVRAALVMVGVMLSSLCLVSCSSSQRAASGKQTEKPRVTFVLFDISGSTETNEVRRRYVEDFESIVASADGGETIAGDRITDNSLATASYPVWASIPRYNPFVNNRQSYLRERRKCETVLKRQVSSLVIGSTPAPRTDLMSAMQLAAKVFSGDPFDDAREKRLVIFSDMVEQSAMYDFTRERLTPRRVAEIIERERKNGRLPDLTGVKVWISGAGNSSGHKLSSAKIMEIRDFWLAYFAACHADLDDSRYVPRLINFR